MKIFLLFLIVILPLITYGQNDFESRYFTIDATSLPVIPQNISPSFSLNKAPVLGKKVKAFKMTAENFWQPVNMAEAISESNKYLRSNVDISPINAKSYGLTGFSGYSDDHVSSPVNLVYKESRGLYLLDPYPRYRICSSCVSYRIDRGF